MPDKISLPRLLLKSLVLFLIANLALGWLTPAGKESISLSRISAYNHLFPGRLRLPYGEKPEQAYNLSLFDLRSMFASHAIAGAEQEYRVVILGDSSVWGFLLRPEETLSAQLNAMQLTTADGRPAVFYNLGYPTMSLTKDLLILQQALEYEPHLILWLVTLESFPRDKQIASPIVQHNARQVRELITDYRLALDTDDAGFINPTIWSRSLIGQRRAIADQLRLQLYGVLWAATGIDQYYPQEYDPPQSDLAADLSFHSLQNPATVEELQEGLAVDVLAAGVELAGSVPVVFVNEPVYISQGANSHIRYNFFYPQWAYDQYRQMLATTCEQNGWEYLDVWDIVPREEFTNSAIHLTPRGEAMLADRLAQALSELWGR